MLWRDALDSLTDGIYLEADASDRETITLDRAAFGGWLAAWEAELIPFYPAQGAIVNEVLAQTIRVRAGPLL